MYLGSSPFDAPGTYTLLQWTETCEGIWYPIGGFHKVVQSLVEIAESHGAKYHFSSAIVAVTHDALGRATGVQLADGQWKGADVVVVNADLVWAHNNLFLKDGSSSVERKAGLVKTEGRNARAPEELLGPKLAKRLLDKPHS